MLKSPTGNISLNILFSSILSCACYNAHNVMLFASHFVYDQSSAGSKEASLADWIIKYMRRI